MLDSMGCDPGLNLVETEPEMPTDSEGRDRVRVPPAGAAVDEGFGHAHQLGDLLNREVAGGREEDELLRLFLGRRVP